MLQQKKRTAIHTPGNDRGRFGKGKQYVRKGTNSESHLPVFDRDPATQTDADKELHTAAKAEMQRWLKSQGTTLNKLLKKKTRRKR